MAKPTSGLRFIHRTKIGTPPEKLGYRLQERFQDDNGHWLDWEDVPVVEEEDVPVREEPNGH